MRAKDDVDLGGMWGLVALVICGAAAWMTMAGLTLAWPSAMAPILACASLEALSVFYRTRRPDPRIAACLTGVAQLVAFSAAAGCLSYAAAATAGPLWDGTLLALDRAMGLDWRAYLAFVDQRPWLGKIYTLAYQSLKLQLLMAVLVLGFTGRLCDLRRFLSAFMVTALATILVSAMVPAMAMYSALGLRPSAFPHLDPAAAFVHVAAMNGLRDGSLHVLSLGNLEGIITFPSLHAALGVLLAVTFWPVALLRWPALVLNALLIAATPIDGGHYFTDVIFGMAMAVFVSADAGWRATRALVPAWIRSLRTAVRACPIPILRRPRTAGVTEDRPPTQPWPMLRDGPAGLLSMRVPTESD